MSDHDIDKYFRDNLSGITEPTSADDLKAFTALASKRKKVVWPFFLAGFILISTGIVYLYTFINQDINKITSTTYSNSNKSKVENSKSQNTALIEGQKLDDSKNKTIEPTESNKPETDDISSNSTPTSEEIENGLSQSDFTQNESFGIESNSKTNTPDSSNNNELTEAGKSNITNRNNANDLTSHASNNATNSSPASANTVSQQNFQEETGGLSSTTETESTFKNSHSEDPSRTQFSGQAAMDMEIAFNSIKSISAKEIENNSAAELNANTSLNDQSEINTWSLDIFAQFELNNELGGIPSAGFISNWQKNKWKLGAGLGIGQTGTLNWTQSREDISYGFDVYKSADEVNTKNFTFITMPLLLSRSLHARGDAFIGINPSLIINASQAFRNSEDPDGSTSGYEYQFGTPDLLLFINLGYSYSINDALRLDIGMNYSPQKWDAISGKPLGGFLRLKYNIR